MQFVQTESEHVAEQVRCGVAGEPSQEGVRVGHWAVGSDNGQPAPGPGIPLYGVDHPSVVTQSNPTPVSSPGQRRVVAVEPGRKAEQDGADEGQRRTLACLVGAVEYRDRA